MSKMYLEIDLLLKNGIKLKEVKSLSQKIKGSIVITGIFSQNRDQIKALLEEHGFKVTSSLSKSTSYLLVGESSRL